MNIAQQNEAVRRCLEEIRASIAANMQEMGRNATGESVASLNVRMNERGGALYGAEQWRTMETGNKGFVPVGVIFDWSLAKGLSFQDERARWSFSYAVQYNIRYYGTRLFRLGRPQDIYTTAINEAVAKLYKELGSLYAAQVGIINKDF